MKRYLFSLYIFTALVLNIHVLFAQGTSVIEVKSQVDTALITIGDRINYSIIIDRREDLQILKPGEGLNLGMFEIKEYNFHEPLEKDGRIIERYDFSISVYDTGEFVIPPFPVAYFNGDSGAAASIIEAPAIDIFVQSVISGDDAGELKDVKPPLEIPFNYIFWISMAAVALLLALAAYLGYRLWKKRQEKGYLFTPPPPPKPCHEVALAALDELFGSDLLEKGAYKMFFSQLSEILRVYLEGRYYISAMEETTSEIMRDMKEHLGKNGLENNLKNILLISDLVKFAKHIPDNTEIDSVKTDSLSFVNETKIVFELPDSIPADSAAEKPVQQISAAAESESNSDDRKPVN